MVNVAEIKDSSRQAPTPTTWRPVFKDIARALAEGDYQLQSCVTAVKHLQESSALFIQQSIRNYGARLTLLSDDTWQTSVCIWTGKHWDVLIDLWTEEEGPSDLVLSAQVFESHVGFVYEVQMVYVP